jgi:hypothetical protein
MQDSNKLNKTNNYFKIIQFKGLESNLENLEIQQIINKHNKYRKAYGVQLLKHDCNLDNSAQTIANNISENPTDENFRERENVNTMIMHSNYDDISVCVDKWMSESYLYIKGQNQFENATKHFSKIIGKDSFRIGIGKTNMKHTGYILIVCIYGQ